MRADRLNATLLSSDEMYIKNVISNIIKTVKITRLIKRIDLLKH
jgi:hypothetical protein